MVRQTINNQKNHSAARGKGQGQGKGKIMFGIILFLFNHIAK